MPIREIAGKVGLHVVERVRSADSPPPRQLRGVRRKAPVLRSEGRLVRRDDAGLELHRYA